jgi:hypothetical protein
MRQAIKTWLPLALVLTLAVAGAYAVGHYTFRQSANDPQIQLAEDWAGKIEAGTDITRLNLGTVIDPTKSLAPFGIIYNHDGSIANSSAVAPSTMMQPDGVLSAVESATNNETRFTWQLASGARFATIIKKAHIADKTYYVLAARNLREVETRGDDLLLLCGMVWAVGQVLLIITLNLHIAARAARKVTRR